MSDDRIGLGQQENGSRAAAPTVDPFSGPASHESPYRPLRPYEEADAHVFVGRDDLRRRLYLRTTPGAGVVALIGPAGAGKTSLIAAGLIPEVRRSGLRRGDGRVPAHVVTLTPGVSPLNAVAGALGIDVRTVATASRDDVIAAAAASSRLTDRACLLVLDQAEELFGLCDRHSRARMLDVLDALGSDSRFAVLVVLRADHYSHALAEPVLNQALDHRTVVNTTVGDDEIRTIVDQPAALAGGSVEPGLADAIVADVADADGPAAPLVALSLVLDRLWRSRDDHRLTLADYLAGDRIRSVVADTAERVWTSLSPTAQETARLVLLAITPVGPDGDPVARSATRDELHRRLGARPDLDAVVSHLVAGGLLRVEGSGVRLAHDSVATAWPRFTKWLVARRSGAAVREAIGPDAARWDAGGRPTDLLYDAGHLRDVDSAVERFDELGPAATLFLDHSRGRARRHRSWRIGAVAAGAVVAVIAVVVATVSLTGSDDDDDGVQAVLARSAALAPTDPSSAARLAAQAFADAPSNSAAQSAMLATQSLPLARTLTSAPAAATVGVGGPDSTRTAVIGRDGTIEVADGATARVTATIPPGFVDPRRPVAALSSDGSVLAAAGPDGSVRLWRVDGSGRVGAPGVLAPARERPAVSAMTFVPGRPTLAVATPGALRLLDITDPARAAVSSTVDAPGGSRITALAASGRTPTIVGASVNGTVSAWDVSRSDAPRALSGTVGLGRPATALAVAPDGAGVAVGDRSGATSLATLDSAGLRRTGGRIVGPGPVQALSFAPQGRRLVISAAGAARVVDTTRPAAPVVTDTTVVSPGGVASARFVTSSTLIATGAAGPVGTDPAGSAVDGGARLWSLPAGVVDGGFGSAFAPACSLARTMCAVSHTDGPVQVVDAADPAAPVVAGAIDAPDHFDGAAMSPDGLWMMTVDARHLAQLWDVTSFATPIAVGPPVALGPQPVDVVSFSPSSGTLAMTADGGRTVGLWSVTRQGLLDVARLDPGSQPATSVAFTPDSRQIAVGGADGVRRWSLTDRAATPVPGALAAGTDVTSVGYGASDRTPTVLVGTAAGAVIRVNAATGATIGEPRALSTAPVTSVIGVGEDVVTGSGDGSVRRVASDGVVTDLGPSIVGPGGDTRLFAYGPGTVLVTGDAGHARFVTISVDAARDRVCAAGLCP